jgi:hypothetical protein
MGCVSANAHAQRSKKFLRRFFQKAAAFLNLVAVIAAVIVAVTAMGVIAAMVVISVMRIIPDTARQAECEESERQRRGKKAFLHTTNMEIRPGAFNVHA